MRLARRKQMTRERDLNASGLLDVYVDGADEINSALERIKGGGAALSREKTIAGA